MEISFHGGYIMVDASPYLLEHLLELLETSRTTLSKDSAKEKKENEESLDQSLKKFEEIKKKYPDDNEIKLQYKGFLSFCEERSTFSTDIETEKLDKIIHDLKQLIEWRKVQGASGRTLGKKSFRQLRGDREKRGE